MENNSQSPSTKETWMNKHPRWSNGLAFLLLFIVGYVTYFDTGKKQMSWSIPLPPISEAQAASENPPTQPAVNQPPAQSTQEAQASPATPAQQPAAQEKPTPVVPAAQAAPAPKAVTTVATAYLPMAKKGEIPSPQVLAQRIRESLIKNPSGNGMVRGANIDANSFLRAIQKAGGIVTGVHALPEYLDSLQEGAMPSGKITMSRVRYTKNSVGEVKYVLDIDRGFARIAHVGERGWYDANTGRLILAGDCSNSPLSPTVNFVPSPAPVVQAPVPLVDTKCPQGWTVIPVVYRSDALREKGVSEAIHRARASDNELDSGRLSRKFGGVLWEKKYPRTQKSYRAELILIKRDGSVIPFWQGEVTEKYVRIPLHPSAVDGDLIRLTFDRRDQGGLASPVINKEGQAVITASFSEFKNCGTRLNAIEKDVRS